MYGPIRQCNDLLDYPVGPYRVVASLRRVLPLRSVTPVGRCLPSAWNGSWNETPKKASAAGAVSAMTCVIGAA